MNIVAIADIRPSNRLRAFVGDGNDDRMGLIRKLGEKTASQIKLYNDHRELLADKSHRGRRDRRAPQPARRRWRWTPSMPGKHVLTEKLMAHDITQCKQMIRKAKEKEAAVGRRTPAALQRPVRQRQPHRPRGPVGRREIHSRPMAPQQQLPQSRQLAKSRPRQSISEALESRIKEYGFDSMERLINWRLYNETGGGLMAELGSHQMDAASIFLGKKHPLAVQGYGGKNFYGVQGVGSKDKQDRRSRDRRPHLRHLRVPRPALRAGSEGHLHRHLLVDQHEPPRTVRRNCLRQPRHPDGPHRKRRPPLQGRKPHVAPAAASNSESSSSTPQRAAGPCSKRTKPTRAATPRPKAPLP